MCIIMRYLNSKICRGRIAPGKSTRGKGKSGSSTTSSDLGEPVWCLSGKDEAEQLRVLGLWRRRKWWRSEDINLLGLGFKGEQMVLGFKPRLWVRDEEEGEGMSCGRAISE